MQIRPKVVDLFHGDTVTSFADVCADGIRGVIHKATEGSSFSDAAYASRRHDALDENLLWGAYHFLRPGDAAGQAHRFLDIAKPTDTTRMSADHEDPHVSLDSLIVFLTEIVADTKRKADIYSGFLIKEQLRKATADQRKFLAGHRLWFAQYAKNPKWPSLWTAPSLWQFTETGTVTGISGHCDVNSFAGSDDELEAQWGG